MEDIPVQKRVNIEDKGPFTQGSPKNAPAFRGQSTSKLQAIATSHSQQHGDTPCSGSRIKADAEPGDTMEADYERNT